MVNNIEKSGNRQNHTIIPLSRLDGKDGPKILVDGRQLKFIQYFNSHYGKSVTKAKLIEHTGASNEQFSSTLKILRKNLKDVDYLIVTNEEAESTYTLWAKDEAPKKTEKRHTNKTAPGHSDKPFDLNDEKAVADLLRPRFAEPSCTYEPIHHEGGRKGAPIDVYFRSKEETTRAIVLVDQNRKRAPSNKTELKPGRPINKIIKAHKKTEKEIEEYQRQGGFTEPALPEFVKKEILDAIKQEPGISARNAYWKISRTKEVNIAKVKKFMDGLRRK